MVSMECGLSSTGLLIQHLTRNVTKFVLFANHFMALDARQPGWVGTLPALSIFFHDIMGGLEQDTLISTHDCPPHYPRLIFSTYCEKCILFLSSSFSYLPQQHSFKFLQAYRINILNYIIHFFMHLSVNKSLVKDAQLQFKTDSSICTDMTDIKFYKLNLAKGNDSKFQQFCICKWPFKCQLNQYCALFASLRALFHLR